jgi:hypothetical protein
MSASSLTLGMPRGSLNCAVAEELSRKLHDCKAWSLRIAPLAVPRAVRDRRCCVRARTGGRHTGLAPCDGPDSL